MPRKDRIHDAVKNALIKDGWTITDDPFRIHYEDADVYADLRAEKPMREEGARRALVIEIKSFLDASAIHNLGTAIGQIISYRSLLRMIAPQDTLYLAIDDLIYRTELQRKSFQLIMRDNRIPLVVVNIVEEEIVTWINSYATEVS